MKCRVRVSSKYEGYPRIPDFGACYGKYVVMKDIDDGCIVKVYKAKKQYTKRYVNRIKKKGFFFYESKRGVDIYMNDYFDMIGITYKKGCVVIVYVNAFEDL